MAFSNNSLSSRGNRSDDDNNDNNVPRHRPVVPTFSLWWIILVVVVIGSTFHTCQGSGIPGTTQTISGYDTELGVDAICWRSKYSNNGLKLPNPLVKDFSISVSGVTLLQACPVGNNISGVAPNELVIHGERLRTKTEYNYTVFLNINFTSLGATNGLTSDRGPGFLAVQVLNCVAGASGFCSPFIHEEANARLEEQEALIRAANPNNVSEEEEAVAAPDAPTPRPRGALHGDSHVHSGYTYVELPLKDGPVFKDLQVQIPMMVLSPLLYFSIVSVQLYFWKSTVAGEEAEMIRYDMSNALFGDQRLIAYQEPANILEVSTEVVYFSYILIGISSCIILFLTYQTFKHRNHQIMKLSQGQFLLVFLIFAFIGTATSFMLEPRNDFYCCHSSLISLTCLQVVYAVTAGRLWRIHALISPLLLKTLTTETSPWARFTHSVKKLYTTCCCRDKSPKKLRNQVKDYQLWILVFVLVAPQVIVQILAVLLQPRSQSIEFNKDESKGREICKTDNDVPFGRTILHYGFALFLLLVLCLLTMALQSRKLPSLFNESKRIFDSTLTSLLVIVMGLTVVLVTDDPATNPAVSYLVGVFVILSITVNTSLRIVLPKLRMIWRGETVIVSQLVMDHTQKLRQAKSIVSHGGISTSDNGGSGRPNNGSKGSFVIYSGNKSSRMDRSSSCEPQRKSDEMKSETEDISLSFNEQPSPYPTSPDAHVIKLPKRIMPQSASMPELPSTTGGRRRKSRKGEIVIEPNQAPSRRLTLKMVDMQAHLDRVVQRIMSGLVVSQEDWEETRRLAEKFGEVFTEIVAFSWDESTTEEAFVDDPSRREDMIEGTIEEGVVDDTTTRGEDVIEDTIEGGIEEVSKKQGFLTEKVGI